MAKKANRLDINLFFETWETKCFRNSHSWMCSNTKMNHLFQVNRITKYSFNNQIRLTKVTKHAVRSFLLVIIIN